MVEKEAGTGVLLPQGESFITLTFGRIYNFGTYLFGLQSLPATCIGSGATVFAPEPFAPCVAPWWSCLRNKRKVMLRFLPGMVPIEHGGDTVRKWVGLLVRQKPRKDAIQLAN